MEPYLYIIIAIVLFIFNSYKTLQEKKAAQQKKSEDKELETYQEASPLPTAEEEFKTIIEKMLTGESPKKKMESSPPPVKTTTPINKPFYESQEVLIDELADDNEAIDKQPSGSESSYRSYQGDLKKDINKIEDIQQLAVIEEDESHSRSEFDLRDAIIYSEILKRPNY